MKHPLILALLAVTVAAGACGGDEEAGDAPESTPAQRTAPETSRREPAEEADEAPDVEAAEDAARDELPNVPLWKGARFKGTVISDTEVCVDRILTKSSAEAIGGTRTSHVVVTWPELNVGEPQDGPCAKAEENEERAVSAAREFYLRMDDLALALDDAIAAAQNDAAGAVSRIARLRTRIRDRLNDYLLEGGETSVGANLLLSAATTSREAAQAGDVAELADQRSEVAAARAKLAEELKP